MNKILVSLSVLCMACFSVSAQQKNSNMEKTNILVAYFSATGTTAKVAHRIEEISKGDIYEITPEQSYTKADLDWHNQKSRSSLEMNDAKSRPALKGQKENMQDYDTVFIGYPIWWDQAPRIINTFIESHHLEGKKLIPFATSGSSEIGNSVNTLKKTYPDLEWESGRLMNNVSPKALQSWVDSFK